MAKTQLPLIVEMETTSCMARMAGGVVGKTNCEVAKGKLLLRERVRMATQKKADVERSSVRGGEKKSPLRERQLVGRIL